MIQLQSTGPSFEGDFASGSQPEGHFLLPIEKEHGEEYVVAAKTGDIDTGKRPRPTWGFLLAHDPGHYKSGRLLFRSYR